MSSKRSSHTRASASKSADESTTTSSLSSTRMSSTRMPRKPDNPPSVPESGKSRWTSSRKSRTETKLASSTAPDISITGDRVELFPTGYTSAPPHETHDQNLVEHMARFRESPMDFLREISLHVQGSGWRSYDNVIGQPVYYPGFSENMKDAVLASPMLNAKIRDLAARRADIEEREGRFRCIEDHAQPSPEVRKASRRSEIESNIRDVADGMVDDMICKMESKPFIRSAYYIATALLTRAYHQGIHVSSEEVLQLRAVAERAAQNNQSIIFLPSHRSHVDYVSMQLICYRLGMTLPTVVAGDNLNFPLVGPFLQHAGAMWIRRSFGDDTLYITLLQAYIDTLLQRGFNFECFIEGGRSRMGKLLPPKFGILGFVIDSLLSGRVKDAIICPVSTQYDKVIEVDSYISELLGRPKAKENLSDFLSASSVLSLQLGRVDVRFQKPWSLREFIQEQAVRVGAPNSPQQSSLNSGYTSEMRIRILRTLGYKVLADINEVSVVMPTSLIGTVLLTLRGRGVGRSELIARVEWLSEKVRFHGGRVAHFAGQPTEIVVQRGLEVLGKDLVGVEKGLVEDTYYAVDRFQLSFYRNMTIHLFVNQAVLCAGMYTTIKTGSTSPQESHAISYKDLLREVEFLSQLFRGEFIFPTTGLETNVINTLDSLESGGVIDIEREVDTRDNDLSAARGASASENDGTIAENATIKSVRLSEAERVDGRNNFDFYCFLIWPFIEAAWLGAVSCLMLTPPLVNGLPLEGSTSTPWLDARAVQDAAQLLGKTLFAQGDLSYYEAVNKETLKNAFQRFEEEGIVLTRKPTAPNNPPASTSADGGSGSKQASNTSSSSTKPPPVPAQVIGLASDWMPRRDPSTGAIIPRGRLWDFCEEISRSRLEGKNRRDGEAVVKRLLRLVETVSASLWQSSTLYGDVVSTESADEERHRKEKRRRAPLMPRASI